MKKILALLLLSALSLHSVAQTQFDYMNGLPVNSMVDGCFFINMDSDPENEGKVVHTNGDIWFESVDTSVILAPSYRVNGLDFWSDCEEFQDYKSTKVYIMNGHENIGLGTHVLPFKWNNLIHYLVINLIDETNIRIRGWVFNIEPNNFTCFSTLSLEDFKTDEQFEFKEYNTLGQSVDSSYTGVVIKVFSNGLRKTTIR